MDKMDKMVEKSTKKVTYDVSLSNGDCCFDYADGFETPEEALDWADGRGGNYVIHIGRSDDLGLSISASDTSKGMQYQIYNVCEWVRISRQKIIDTIR